MKFYILITKYKLNSPFYRKALFVDYYSTVRKIFFRVSPIWIRKNVTCSIIVRS